MFGKRKSNHTVALLLNSVFSRHSPPSSARTSPVHKACLSSQPGDATMSITTSKLDEMQSTYKAAVDEWIAAIRQEEALASVNHTVADVDNWESADFREEDARNKAKAAKKIYEEALRQEFFNF
jgi:hypothetical protein